MRAYSSLSLAFFAFVTLGAPTAAAEPLSNLLADASVKSAKVTAMAAIGTTSISISHELDGCHLRQIETSQIKDRPDQPHVRIAALDLRYARKVMGVTADKGSGFDSVRIGLSKGVAQAVEKDFGPVKQAVKERTEALAKERGVKRFDFKRRNLLKAEVVLAVHEGIKAGEFGDAVKQAYLINGPIIQPPLPIARFNFAVGKGEALAAAISGLMQSTCRLAN